MTPANAVELGLTIWKTSVGAQKIDGLPLETYGMASTSFLLQDSLERIRFFKENFLLADTSIKVVLGMIFLAFSNANFQFSAKELIWTTFTIAEALAITSQVELIDKREFAKAALDENSKTFVIYVSVLDLTELLIHPSQVA